MPSKWTLLLVALIATGCTHQRATISTDARKVLTVVSPRDMSEDEAQRVYERSGVYRGLTDAEWLEVMRTIEALQLMEVER